MRIPYTLFLVFAALSCGEKEMDNDTVYGLEEVDESAILPPSDSINAFVLRHIVTPDCPDLGQKSNGSFQVYILINQQGKIESAVCNTVIDGCTDLKNQIEKILPTLEQVKPARINNIAVKSHMEIVLTLFSINDENTSSGDLYAHHIFEQTELQELPEFPGGVEKLNAFLYGELKYPEAIKDKSIEFRALISVVVERDGTLSHMEPLSGEYTSVSGGDANIFYNEAMRIIKKMPAWTPGKRNQHTVRTRCTLSIRFFPKNSD